MLSVSSLPDENFIVPPSSSKPNEGQQQLVDHYQRNHHYRRNEAQQRLVDHYRRMYAANPTKATQRLENEAEQLEAEVDLRERNLHALESKARALKRESHSMHSPIEAVKDGSSRQAVKDSGHAWDDLTMALQAGAKLVNAVQTCPRSRKLAQAPQS